MKNAFLGFKLEQGLKNDLKALADSEDRTMSQMAVILLQEAMESRRRRQIVRQETAQEFMARLDRRVERKRQENI
jgi:hypothetical protein